MIVLKSPQKGEKFDLLTDIQIKFLESHRQNVDEEEFDCSDFKKDNTDDFRFPREINFEWEAKGESTLQISESENFDTCYCQKGNNTASVVNLKCGTHYFWRVVYGDEISDTFYFDTKDRCPRFVKIDGLTNVRDCGGWKTISGKHIKQGLLYRGTEMNSRLTISENGLKTMREVLKINSVLDLRWEDEGIENVYKGKYINVQVMPYSQWFCHPNVARSVFEFVLNKENYPVYFHCQAGADRTGTLAFLLGAVLGQKYEDLIDDYQITFISAWGGEQSKKSSKLCRSFLDDFDRFEGETTEEKAKNYLLSCGISETLIEDFREFMLH